MTSGEAIPDPPTSMPDDPRWSSVKISTVPMPQMFSVLPDGTAVISPAPLGPSVALQPSASPERIRRVFQPIPQSLFGGYGKNGKPFGFDGKKGNMKGGKGDYYTAMGRASKGANMKGDMKGQSGQKGVAKGGKQGKQPAYSELTLAAFLPTARKKSTDPEKNTARSNTQKKKLVQVKAAPAADDSAESGGAGGSPADTTSNKALSAGAAATPATSSSSKAPRQPTTSPTPTAPAAVSTASKTGTSTATTKAAAAVESSARATKTSSAPREASTSSTSATKKGKPPPPDKPVPAPKQPQPATVESLLLAAAGTFCYMDTSTWIPLPTLNFDANNSVQQQQGVAAGVPTYAAPMAFASPEQVMEHFGAMCPHYAYPYAEYWPAPPRYQGGRGYKIREARRKKINEKWARKNILKPLPSDCESESEDLPGSSETTAASSSPQDTADRQGSGGSAAKSETRRRSPASSSKLLNPRKEMPDEVAAKRSAEVQKWKQKGSYSAYVKIRKHFETTAKGVVSDDAPEVPITPRHDDMAVSKRKWKFELEKWRRQRIHFVAHFAHILPKDDPDMVQLNSEDVLAAAVEENANENANEDDGGDSKKRTKQAKSKADLTQKFVKVVDPA
ncbi:unnamed protein product [Amoebophrya sp. A25]|nr:unnamed protein product [Amoebophrya sp. A25]|eukprot:GSA25T00014627001.1